MPAEAQVCSHPPKLGLQVVVLHCLLLEGHEAPWAATLSLQLCGTHLPTHALPSLEAPTYSRSSWDLGFGVWLLSASQNCLLGPITVQLSLWALMPTSPKETLSQEKEYIKSRTLDFDSLTSQDARGMQVGAEGEGQTPHSWPTHAGVSIRERLIPILLWTLGLRVRAVSPGPCFFTQKYPKPVRFSAGDCSVLGACA